MGAEAATQQARGEALRVLNLAIPQINLKAVFLQLPKTEVQAFWDEHGYTNLPSAWGSIRATTLPHSVAQAQLSHWKSLNGTNILGQAQVTTRDGRQTEISVVDLRTIVVRDAQGQARKEEVPLGPTLEVTPHVTEDGLGVKMGLRAKVVKFVGYGDVGPFPVLPPDSGMNAGLTVTSLPLPHFRLAELTGSLEIPDGQTAVLGNFSGKDATALKETVPVLGDVPIVGRLFRDGSGWSPDETVLLLITPTITDPAGNSYHPRRSK